MIELTQSDHYIQKTIHPITWSHICDLCEGRETTLSVQSPQFGYVATIDITHETLLEISLKTEIHLTWAAFKETELGKGWDLPPEQKFYLESTWVIVPNRVTLYSVGSRTEAGDYLLLSLLRRSYEGKGI